MAGELADESAVGARPADEAAHALEIALGVWLALVVGEALDAFGENGVGFGWEGGEHWGQTLGRTVLCLGVPGQSYRV